MLSKYRLPLIAALGAFALVAVVLFVFRHEDPPQTPAAVTVAAPSPSPSESPSPSPSPLPPSPEPSPAESAPPAAEGLPACYKKVGTDAPPAVVRDTLVAAGRKQYWTTTKGIVVPSALMKAIAWQKSRWQSSITSCDGNSVGLMQVSPKTADGLNTRFTVVYDVNTLKGNAALGAEYLEWLIKHFAETTYTSAKNPFDVMGNPGMLDMVISAYTAGPTALDKAPTTIPNPEFVAQVKALMTNCPCLKI